MLIENVKHLRASIKRLHIIFSQYRWNTSVRQGQKPLKHSPSLFNKFEQDKAVKHIENEKVTRKLNGSDVNAISPVKGPEKSKKNRKKVLCENSPHKIMEFLHFESDLDVTMYNTAIKACGSMRNVQSCQQIMSLMKKRNVVPTVYSYSILFHALNKNNRADLADFYLDEMLNVYKLKPNNVVLTTLLGGCTHSGDVQKANRILKVYENYDIQLDALTYIELIHTYGQHGDYDKCQNLYDEMVSKDQHAQVAATALMHAYLKSNQISNALRLKRDFENAGYKMDEIAYTPFVAFYLKTSEYFNPHESLKLSQECKSKNGLMCQSSAMINMKFVAYQKLMLMEQNADKKSEYFELIKTIPIHRESNRLPKWNVDSARIVFDAHLIYYNHNFNHPEIIKCFDNLSKYLGYLFFDNRTEKWMLDLHGYNYNQAKFALYHILIKKTDELVSMMGFEWQIICGTQKGASPTSKESQLGIKQFVITRLENSFQIKAKVDSSNAGRIHLNSVDVKRHVESIRERQKMRKARSVASTKRDH